MQDLMNIRAKPKASAPVAESCGQEDPDEAAREWGPGLRDRIAQLGPPIAAHHGPANAVATASVAGSAVAYSVGQTGMLRIFALSGAQARRFFAHTEKLAANTVTLVLTPITMCLLV